MTVLTAVWRIDTQGGSREMCWIFLVRDDGGVDSEVVLGMGRRSWIQDTF